MIEKLLLVSLPAWCVADAFAEIAWEKVGLASLFALVVVLYITKFLPQQREEERMANEKMRTDYLEANRIQREEERLFNEKARTDFLKANAESRVDYLKSYTEQRVDFVSERAYDRELKAKLVSACDKIADTQQRFADALEAHGRDAREVWSRQGFMGDAIK